MDHHLHEYTHVRNVLLHAGTLSHNGNQQHISPVQRVLPTPPYPFPSTLWAAANMPQQPSNSDSQAV